MTGAAARTAQHGGGGLAPLSVSSDSVTAGLPQSLFKVLDTNRDGQLALNEFTVLLKKLIGELAGSATSGDLGSSATAVVPGSLSKALITAPRPEHSRVYTPMAGWNTEKLNYPAAQSVKYKFGRFIQDEGYDPNWARQNMPAIVNAFNKAHGYNARALDDDNIDFGLGPGFNIDVINAGGYWQWLVNG
jgi:hypothetical protein